MGFFTPRLIDPEVVEWQFDYFGWLISNFSSGPGLPDSNLWLPVPEQFEPESGHRKLQGAELAEFLFKTVKRQCGFPDDQTINLLAADESKPHSLGGVAIVKPVGASACGRYIIEELRPGEYKETITYDADLTKQPMNLVATFAHELAHALHNRSKEPVDIDPEIYELFTDLTAVYLGYGIFLANSRFEFSQFQDGNLQGWQASGAGYLPEADLIFATALFMTIKNIPEQVATPYLKPRLQKMLKKALKQLQGYGGEIDRLRKLRPMIN